LSISSFIEFRVRRSVDHVASTAVADWVKAVQLGDCSHLCSSVRPTVPPFWSAFIYTPAGVLYQALLLNQTLQIGRRYCRTMEHPTGQSCAGRLGRRSELRISMTPTMSSHLSRAWKFALTCSALWLAPARTRLVASTESETEGSTRLRRGRLQV